MTIDFPTKTNTVKCPICKHKYHINNIKMHLYHTSKTEVWNKALGMVTKTPHFDLYKKHTVPIMATRHWKVTAIGLVKGLVKK